MANRERSVETFTDLVKIDSLSLKEGKIADYIENKLKTLGFEVWRDKSHEKHGGETGNVIAFKKGNIDKKGIAFVAHMDTVVPGEGINPIIDGDIIRTDGSTILGADDKAGIVAMLEAAECIKENDEDHGPVYFIFTIAEEIGLYGAKGLDLSKINAKYVYVLDSEGDLGRIVISAPSQNSINAVFTGKPAHAGVNPEDGISSIIAASRAISSMTLGRIDEETTANIGIIKGGLATNIIPEKTEIKGEVRSLSEEKLEKQTKKMHDAIIEAADSLGAKVKIDIVREFGAFNLSVEDDAIQNVKKAFEKLGVNMIAESTGGGSDTNVFNSKGIKAVNLSVGMEEVHSTKEFIKINTLVDAAEMVRTIILL